MFSCNKETMRLLVDALRSKEYQQGKSCLRNEHNAFCCLGVGADLAVKAGVQPAPILRSSIRTAYQYPTDNAKKCSTEGYLPSYTRDWLGLQVSDIPLFIRGEQVLASHLNDTGYTFAQIADLIEEQYLTPATV